METLETNLGLYPDIGRPVTCGNCNDYCLPPYNMCLGAHLACNPCIRYLHRCRVCDRAFASGPHRSFDLLMATVRHPCKYRAAAYGRPRVVVGDGDADADRRTEAGCPDRRYTVQELFHHYRGSCTRNAFTCPLDDCGRACHVETAVEHYEAAHGPFKSVVPDPRQPKGTVAFLQFDSVEIKKIFNGYLSFSMKSLPTAAGDQITDLTMENLNPADLLQYTYKTYKVRAKNKNAAFVTVTVKNDVFN